MPNFNKKVTIFHKITRYLIEVTLGPHDLTDWTWNLLKSCLQNNTRCIIKHWNFIQYTLTSGTVTKYIGSLQNSPQHHMGPYRALQ